MDDSAEKQMVALFAGKTPAEQKALLARLERAGASLYRAWADAEKDPEARRELLASAEREEENARALEKMKS